MSPYAEYDVIATQIIGCLRRAFGVGKADILLIEQHIIETDAFRNDVIAAQRSTEGWHQNFVDVVMAIVECGKGKVSKDMLQAYAAIAAASTFSREASQSFSPEKLPTEHYVSALDSLTELNDIAYEAELEPTTVALRNQG